jgi:hypothetical protein
VTKYFTVCFSLSNAPNVILSTLLTLEHNTTGNKNGVEKIDESSSHVHLNETLSAELSKQYSVLSWHPNRIRFALFSAVES